jgi:hypothetical protein
MTIAAPLSTTRRLRRGRLRHMSRSCWHVRKGRSILYMYSDNIVYTLVEHILVLSIGLDVRSTTQGLDASRTLKATASNQAIAPGYQSPDYVHKAARGPAGISVNRYVPRPSPQPGGTSTSPELECCGHAKVNSVIGHRFFFYLAMGPPIRGAVGTRCWEQHRNSGDQ